MRQSIAAVALIQRREGAERLWLAQWNAKWGSYHLIAGHKQPEESFRECMIREIGEELGLREGTDFEVPPAPLAHLEFTALSESAGIETAYTMELFEFRLIGHAARKRIDADPHNRWLSEAAIAAGRSDEGRPISSTMALLLSKAGLLPARGLSDAGGLGRWRAEMQTNTAERIEPSVAPSRAAAKQEDDPRVHWLIKALRGMRASLAKEIAAKGAPTDLFEQRCAEQGELLAATFPKAQTIVVCDHLQGYRPSSEGHILLVEVLLQPGPEGPTACEPAGGPTAHIVKTANPRNPEKLKKLAEELEGWQQCRPFGVEHDSVLIPLRSGDPPEPLARGAKPRTLVYADANQVIGGRGTRSLEAVALECCRWGAPPVASIESVLSQIYGRLGTLFYECHYVLGAAANLRQFADEELDAWLSRWDDTQAEEPDSSERLHIRRGTFGILSRQRDLFLDPCDYLRCALKHPDQYAPRMLRGWAHGDLHGRNVLVSLVDDQTLSPAIFDYEDMRRNNLIGWDFVKMETEIKVRAFEIVFPGAETEFLERVLRFEDQLAQRTEAIHDGTGAEDAIPDTPEGRLLALMLAVRKQARLHLGLNRNRGREWLEEYYFLLACYGVRAAQFPTYQRRMVISAYTAAGVAARRLTRPRARFESDIKTWESQAAQLVEESERRRRGARTGGLPLRPSLPAEPREEMSHHARFAFAQRWARSEQEPFMRAAVDLLRELKRKFPHVLEIDEELALVYLELNEDDEAEKLLEVVRVRYDNNLHEETYARLGRLWKDRAVKGAARGRDEATTRRFFSEARDWYRKAYALRGHYYPGINVATLHFVLHEIKAAAQVAGEVLGAAARSENADDLIWVVPTRAEAHLLLGDCEESERLYRQAAENPLCLPHTRATMRRQVKFIRGYAPEAIRRFWTDEKLDSVFGTEKPEDGRTVARNGHNRFLWGAVGAAVGAAMGTAAVAGALVTVARNGQTHSGPTASPTPAGGKTPTP